MKIEGKLIKEYIEHDSKKFIRVTREFDDNHDVDMLWEDHGELYREDDAKYKMNSEMYADLGDKYITVLCGDEIKELEEMYEKTTRQEAYPPDWKHVMLHIAPDGNDVNCDGDKIGILIRMFLTSNKRGWWKEVKETEGYG